MASHPIPTHSGRPIRLLLCRERSDCIQVRQTTFFAVIYPIRRRREIQETRQFHLALPCRFRHSHKAVRQLSRWLYASTWIICYHRSPICYLLLTQLYIVVHSSSSGMVWSMLARLVVMRRTFSFYYIRLPSLSFPHSQVSPNVMNLRHMTRYASPSTSTAVRPGSSINQLLINIFLFNRKLAYVQHSSRFSKKSSQTTG